MVWCSCEYLELMKYLDNDDTAQVEDSAKGINEKIIGHKRSKIQQRTLAVHQRQVKSQPWGEPRCQYFVLFLTVR